MHAYTSFVDEKNKIPGREEREQEVKASILRVGWESDIWI
jgi:hypothetical protein